MRAAKIENGTVVNVMEVDAVETGLIQSDTANIGDGYANGVFTAPVIPAPTPAQLLADKAAVLEQARLMREVALNRLTGIQLNTTVSATITSIQAARTALLNITADAGVVASTDGQTTHAAIMSAWKVIDTNLATDAPSVASVFAGLVV